MITSILIALIVPILVGMFVSWRLPHLWDWDSRGICVFFSIWILIFILAIRFPHASDLTWF